MPPISPRSSVKLDRDSASASTPIGTMALPSSRVLDSLVSSAECRFNSPHNRISLPPLLTSLSTTGINPNMQPTRGAGAYPRRRAVRACQVCRARRTKCDNKKPTCSFCEKTGAKCVVNDPADLSGYGSPMRTLIISFLSVACTWNLKLTAAKDSTLPAY